MFESNTPKKALMFCIAHIISCPLKSTLFFVKVGRKINKINGEIEHIRTFELQNEEDTKNFRQENER